MSNVPSPKMRPTPFVNFVSATAFLLAATLIALSVSCNSSSKFPQKNSKAYSDVVSAFYVGLSALQVGDDVHAESRLSELTRLIPGEPAAWANWGILALRQRNYDAAAQRFQKAQELAPNNDQIYSLMGQLESQRGNSAQALTDLRKAVELNPQNLRATYQLAEETERQRASDGEAQFQKLVERILIAQPNNLAALLELARIAAKQGDAATVKSAVEKIAAQASGWPPEVQRQLKVVQTAVSSGDLHTAATQTTFLRNVLMRVPDYRLSLRAIKAAPGEEAEPFTRFLVMENRSFGPPRRILRSRSIRSRYRTRTARTGIGLEPSPSGALAHPWSPKPMEEKYRSRAERSLHFREDRLRCHRLPKALSLSISTTTSRQIWCSRARAECA
jgi:Flp pilus assembly protein TadD